jgi:hypothetical protein
MALCASEPLFVVEQFTAMSRISIMAHREIAKFTKLPGGIRGRWSRLLRSLNRTDYQGGKNKTENGLDTHYLGLLFIRTGGAVASATFD